MVMDSYDTGYNITYASEFVVYRNSDKEAMKNKILTETNGQNQKRDLDYVFEQGAAVLALAEHRYLESVSLRFLSNLDAEGKEVWHRITFTRARA